MPRRILEGKVVSDKMNKTVTVLVERRTMHPLYKKYIRTSTKYAAHDEHNVFKSGDVVQIQECRPLSARKTWVVISDIEAVKKQRYTGVTVDTDATGAVPVAGAADKKPAAKKTTTKKAK